jgi:prepilin-type N-terminal cleavage/methylation domain-containing protein
MRGVTLVELLISISLAALLASVTIGPGIQQFEAALAQSDGTRMAAIARHARAEAMHGIPHSLYWSDAPHALVIRAAGESDQSYPLAENKDGTASGIIQFLGLGNIHPVGWLRRAASSTGAWEVDSNSEEAITVMHTL